MTPIVLGAAIVLGLVHLAIGRIHVGRLSGEVAGSIGGGIAVAYVFVHVLPDLAERQREIETLGLDAVAILAHHAYLVALLGFVVYFEVERIGTRADVLDRGDPAFWIHLGAFALYNASIGYLLHAQLAAGLVSLLEYVVAIGLHLAVIEYSLQSHYEGIYEGLGQAILAVALVTGAAIGYVATVGTLGRVGLFAFVGGGVVFNAIKEELTLVDEGRFSAFTLGAALYTGLLLVL